MFPVQIKSKCRANSSHQTTLLVSPGYMAVLEWRGHQISGRGASNVAGVYRLIRS